MGRRSRTPRRVWPGVQGTVTRTARRPRSRGEMRARSAGGLSDPLSGSSATPTGRPPPAWAAPPRRPASPRLTRTVRPGRRPVSPSAATARNVSGAIPDTNPWAWYSDPAVLVTEHERIFRTAWHYVGDVGRLPEPPSYFAYTTGGLPVIVTRDGDGELRAF